MGAGPDGLGVARSRGVRTGDIHAVPVGIEVASLETGFRPLAHPNVLPNSAVVEVSGFEFVDPDVAEPDPAGIGTQDLDRVT